MQNTLLTYNILKETKMKTLSTNIFNKSNELLYSVGDRVSNVEWNEIISLIIDEEYFIGE